jgi:hypothetical protein
MHPLQQMYLGLSGAGAFIARKEHQIIGWFRGWRLSLKHYQLHISQYIEISPLLLEIQTVQ